MHECICSCVIIGVSVIQKPRWSSILDQEILSTKKQIENAPVGRNDPELYAPIFRNVSVFKR